MLIACVASRAKIIIILAQNSLQHDFGIIKSELELWFLAFVGITSFIPSWVNNWKFNSCQINLKTPNTNAIPAAFPAFRRARNRSSKRRKKYVEKSCIFEKEVRDAPKRNLWAPVFKAERQQNKTEVVSENADHWFRKEQGKAENSKKNFIFGAENYKKKQGKAEKRI